MSKKNCVLCGKEVGLLDRLTLSVHNTEQTVCSDCYRRYNAAAVPFTLSAAGI